MLLGWEVYLIFFPFIIPNFMRVALEYNCIDALYSFPMLLFFITQIAYYIGNCLS